MKFIRLFCSICLPIVSSLVARQATDVTRATLDITIATALEQDRRFWEADWVTTQAQLVRLMEAVDADAPSKVPVSKLNATKSATNATKAPAAAVGDAFKLLAKLRGKALRPKSAADLAPALAMLEGLYEDGKKHIAELNAREQKSKKWFAEKETEHKEKLAKIESRFTNHKLSQEFRVNETRDENRYYNYWQKVRERQHRQFHTSLKIQHGTMTRVKGMIEMYRKTMSGKADPDKMRKQLARVSGGMPDVVLLQQAQREVVTFCEDSLNEVRERMAELSRAL